MRHKTRFRILLIVFFGIHLVVQSVHLYQMHQTTKRLERMLKVPK